MQAPLIAELRAHREALGWSVAEVAERCGVDESFLEDWERGIGSPGLDELLVWAACFGLSLGLIATSKEPREKLRINWARRQITVGGTPVRLTPMEWKALELLARVPGDLVTHEALFRHLYGSEQSYRPESTAIRVLITKLRRLLPLRIEARWGRGYVVSGVEASTSADPGAAAAQQRPEKPQAEKPQPQAAMAICEPAGDEPGRPAPELRDRGLRETAVDVPLLRGSLQISLAPDRRPELREHAGSGRIGLRPAMRAAMRPAMRSVMRPGQTSPGQTSPGQTSPAQPSLGQPSQAQPSPAQASPCRKDELDVIARFLAERGVTRCPDVATIERSPLPTLIWDRNKRKWVRPAQP